MAKTTTQSWHSLSVAAIYKELDTTAAGLTDQAAKERLATYGSNSLPTRSTTGPGRIFINQLRSPLVYVLLIAAVVSGWLGHTVDMGTIIAIVLLNTLIGFFQEYKTNQALAKLQRYVQRAARVMRDGRQQLVNTVDLVPGDVVLVEAGTLVPADCRLTEAAELTLIEAPLTGESSTSAKTTKIQSRGAALAERENMIYAGTTVANGRGVAVVCATGRATALGQIASLVEVTAEEATPLQDNIAKLARTIAMVMGIVASILFILGVVMGRPVDEMLLMSVAVAVAAIPEGLVVALTIILVLGMRKILRSQALVRRLVAAETLGGTTVICTDKTGTLTVGVLRVTAVITANDQLKISAERPADIATDMVLALRIGALCNDAVVTTGDDPLVEVKYLGDPVDQALLVAAGAISDDNSALADQYPRLAEMPFSSETRMMATVNDHFADQASLLVKGAPEEVLARAKYYQDGATVRELTAVRRKEFERIITAESKKGLRLVAVAYRSSVTVDQPVLPQVTELIFVALVVMTDPLRPGIAEVIATCRQAGIRPVMITGDHPLTAQKIALESGLGVDKEAIITGAELDKLDDAALAKLVGRTTIYARVEPRHKLRIVAALRQAGEVVAMTGDGVNDAPALKTADIGIALGSGTDVAKQTADIVLLNDSFATIVEAIRGGRVIFDNIRKVLVYLLSKSGSELILVGGAILAGWPLPVLAVQILWVNIIQDALPSFALAADPEEPGIMKEKPIGRHTPILLRSHLILMLLVAVITDVALLGVFWYLWSAQVDLATIQTMMFASLAVGSLAFSFSCRSLRRSLFSYNPFRNWQVNGAVVVGLILVVAAVYVPVLQTLLRTVPLTGAAWWVVIGIGVGNVLMIEIGKLLFRRPLNQQLVSAKHS